MKWIAKLVFGIYNEWEKKILIQKCYLSSELISCNPTEKNKPNLQRRNMSYMIAGLDKKDATNIASLYWDETARVGINNANSKAIKIIRGHR